MIEDMMNTGKGKGFFQRSSHGQCPIVIRIEFIRSPDFMSNLLAIETFESDDVDNALKLFSGISSIIN